MNWTLVFEPFIPAFAGLALGGVIAVLAVLGILGHQRGWPLRLMAGTLLLLALFNPALRTEKREPLNDIAVLVVDRSQSQSVAGRKARTDAAEAAARAAIARLPHTEVRVVNATSGQGARDEGTLLFRALDEALADLPADRFAGALMISDGQVHDVPGTAGLARLAGPVHGLITGARGEVDRRIVIDQSPRFGLLDKEQTIRFHIEDQGTTKAAPAQVKMIFDSGETRIISTQSGTAEEVTIPVTHAGQIVTEFAVDALPGELTLENNRAVILIDGIRDRLRVLLVSGAPHPGERIWRNLLKSDPAVDLVHFTILRPPEKQDMTPIEEMSLIAFPTRELFVDKIKDFDLVIFDGYRRDGILPLEYLENVANYVKNGGAVLLAAGPDFAGADSLFFTPLSEILSTEPTGEVLIGPYRPALTKPGTRHPVVRGLPNGAGVTPSWGHWFRTIDTVASDGDVVLSGKDDRPLLVLAHKGQGRVATLLSDQGWLWARGYEGGGPQVELMRRIAHWLMREPELDEEALRARQVQSTLHIERQTMADRPADIKITRPSGAVETVTLQEERPGLWAASIPAAEVGIYRLSDGVLNTAAAIGNQNSREMSDLVATDLKLAPAAQATGGGVQWLADMASGFPALSKATRDRTFAGPGWMALRDNQVFRVSAQRTIPLYGGLLALAVLLAVLGAMWYREGH